MWNVKRKEGALLTLLVWSKYQKGTEHFIVSLGKTSYFTLEQNYNGENMFRAFAGKWFSVYIYIWKYKQKSNVQTKIQCTNDDIHEMDYTILVIWGMTGLI